MTQNNSKLPTQTVPTLNLAGDVSGTNVSSSVNKIQGKSVKTATPNNNDYLTWVNANSDWEPVATTITINTPVLQTTIISGSSNYTITDTDIFIGNVGSFTGQVLFPTSSPTGRMIIISSLYPNNITMVPFSGTTINQSSSNLTLSAGATFVCYDGTNWCTVGYVKP